MEWSLRPQGEGVRRDDVKALCSLSSFIDAAASCTPRPCSGAQVSRFVGSRSSGYLRGPTGKSSQTDRDAWEWDGFQFQAGQCATPSTWRYGLLLAAYGVTPRGFAPIGAQLRMTRPHRPCRPSCLACLPLSHSCEPAGRTLTRAQSHQPAEHRTQEE